MNRFIKGLSYTFYRNLGRTDRIVRLVLALVVLALWLGGIIPGLIGTVLAILAVMIIGTAASARCGVTYWLDANTMSAAEKQELDEKGINYE